MSKADSIALDILELAAEGPAELKPLLAKWPRTTLYRHANKLVKENALKKTGHSYAATDHGLILLSGLRNGTNAHIKDPLAEKIPLLRFYPTREHRAFGALILAAVSARTNHLADAHHPTFRVGGPRMKFKSWLGEAACHALGVDLLTAIIHLPSESGSSLTRRRTAQGQIASHRDVLDLPLAVFEEFDKCKAEVRKATQLYTYGQIEIAFENETLTVNPVPIITSNPKKKNAGDPLESFGLSDADIRRSVMLDLTASKIPSDRITEGDSLLDEIKALGPIDIPPPAAPDLNARKHMQHIITKLLVSEDTLGLIDFKLLELLARGMSSFLEPDVAVEHTLKCALICYSTLRWLREHWETELAALLSHKGQAKRSEGTITMKTNVSMTDNEFNYDARLHRLARACEAAGIEPGEVAELVRGQLEIAEHGFTPEIAALLARELPARKIAPKDAARQLAARVATCTSLTETEKTARDNLAALNAKAREAHKQLNTLKKTVERFGGDEGQLAELMKVKRILAQHNVTPTDVRDFASAVQSVVDISGSPDGRSALVTGMLSAFAAQARSQDTGDRSPKEVARYVARLGAKDICLSTRVATRRQILDDVKEALRVAEVTLETTNTIASANETLIEEQQRRLTEVKREKQREAKKLSQTQRYLSQTERQWLRLGAEIEAIRQLGELMANGTLREPDLIEFFASAYSAYSRGARITCPKPELVPAIQKHVAGLLMGFYESLPSPISRE